MRPVLARIFQPHDERQPVADAVDLVEDGYLWIAAEQEVGMEGVRPALRRYGAGRRDEGLADVPASAMQASAALR